MRLIIPKEVWLRRAAMFCLPTRAHHHHFCTCSLHLHPEIASERLTLRTLTMLDQVQRARMAHSREQALLRRRNKQIMTVQNVCRLHALFGGAQNSSLPSVVDLPYCGPATMRNEQDISVVQHEYGLNASLSKALNNCHNFQGLDVVVSEATVTAEQNEVLGSVPSMTAQEFDYVVVIDFEATCDKNMEKLKPQEIIEFPSVLVDCRRLTLGDYFQTYVKPERHPTLTDFCTHLTGIQQEQVDKGMLLAEAIYWHDKWLEHNGIKDKNFAVVIWSDWDCKVMLDSECKLKGLDKPQYFDRWINLKVIFQSAFNGRKCNLRKAVEACGLKWAGRAHCGLDDAMNTARLAVELMRRGTILTVTGSLDTGSLGTGAPVTKVRRPQWPGMGLEAMCEKFSSSDSVISSVGSVNDAQSSAGSANGCAVLKQPSSIDVQSSVGSVIDAQSSLGSNNGCGAPKLHSNVDVKSSVGSINVGMNTLLCYCGVICKQHSIQKQGSMHGKHFLACGKWTPSDGSRCGFFEWAVS